MSLYSTYEPELMGHVLQVSAVAAESQSNGLPSVLQLLLVVLTLAGVLLLPSLSALIPNFNGHILPSAAYKASLFAFIPHAHLIVADVEPPHEARLADLFMRVLTSQLYFVLVGAVRNRWHLQLDTLRRHPARCLRPQCPRAFADRSWSSMPWTHLQNLQKIMGCKLTCELWLLRLTSCAGVPPDISGCNVPRLCKPLLER